MHCRDAMRRAPGGGYWNDGESFDFPWEWMEEGLLFVATGGRLVPDRLRGHPDVRWDLDRGDRWDEIIFPDLRIWVGPD